MLGGVLQRLEAAEVHSALDVRGIPVVHPGREHADRYRRLQRGGAQCIDESTICQQGRVDPSRKRSHLIERTLHLQTEFTQSLGLAWRVAVRLSDPLGGQLELDPERDEPLLGPVMKVLLDSPALLVRRALNART